MTNYVLFALLFCVGSSTPAELPLPICLPCPNDAR